ncbi:MAG: hypothetical protein ACK56S_11530 [Planctomycetota bacterium]
MARTDAPAALAAALIPALASALVAQTPAAPPTALTHDVPTRGAHAYERTTDQFDVAAPSPRLRVDWLLQDRNGVNPHAWRWLAVAAGAPPAGFEQPDFDDAAWPLGQGEFGDQDEKRAADARQRTAWRTPTLCLRTRLDGGGKKPRALLFRVDHDDGIRVWLNGKQVVADDGYGRGRWYAVAGKALDAWQGGGNTLAVRCNQIGGAQYLDVAVAAIASLPPGAKSADDLLRALREEQQQGNALREQFCGPIRPPALLFHGELDGGGQFLRLPPTDLRDLGFWAAMDLRQGLAGGAVDAEIGRVWRLGDLRLRGTAGAVAADGWQTLDLAVRHEPTLELRGESQRFVDAHVRREVVLGIDARLQVRRRIDHTDGRARVVEFTAALAGKLLRGKDLREPAGTIEQRETWRHKEARDGQDARFRGDVNAALQKGTARLRERLQDPDGGDTSPQPDDGPNSFHSGRLALGLLALVKGGVPKDDEVVQKGLASLRRRTLIDTYSLGNALMLMQALHGRARSVESLGGGAGAGNAAAALPALPADDLALVRKWTERLLGNLDTRGDPTQLLRFNYTAGDRFDNSVNQYGLLGMHAAEQCGMELPTTAWQAAANHLLASQTEGGEKMIVDLTDFRTLREMLGDPGFAPTGTRPTARVRGWSYAEGRANGDVAPTWGGMVCSGITGLAICEAGLLAQDGGRRGKSLVEIRRAREDGFAWLAKHLTVRHQPGDLHRQQHWLYYYLYGLERAAMLSNVALIQGRDWYFEGATMLILSQQPDGGWPGPPHHESEAIYRDAMAILFLKQSTAAVAPITGK